MTIEDAQNYLEPFTVTIPFNLEDICENNRDSAETPGK